MKNAFAPCAVTTARITNLTPEQQAYIAPTMRAMEAWLALPRWKARLVRWLKGGAAVNLHTRQTQVTGWRAALIERLIP